MSLTNYENGVTMVKRLRTTDLDGGGIYIVHENTSGKYKPATRTVAETDILTGPRYLDEIIHSVKLDAHYTLYGGGKRTLNWGSHFKK
jgi:hypothetical protein